MAWYEFALVQISVILIMFFLFKWFNKKETARQPKPIYSDPTEIQELHRLRSRSLTVPLCELSRPKNLSDIIGQENAIAALRAAICGKNPQHILIYGPPGVGKTCAARLLLEEAKKTKESPFDENSQFVEIDATCIRFDERSIADPLLGSVHDPIYQGAGLLGTQGVPQPKAGAVTKAHCGILFLDEIGELHPIQMNKLLKVLEDRRVFFESSYYSKNNRNIPDYIHDIFKNGLPADFRLIGATTRSPEELPMALRSRCVEIFFSPLSDSDLIKISENAARSSGAYATEDALRLCASYCQSGRDCVNMIQLAESMGNEHNKITTSDIRTVANTCRYTQKYSAKMNKKTKCGTAYGLGVANNLGMLIEIECVVKRTMSGNGKLTIRGAVCEEEIEVSGRRLKRQSLVRSSAENVLCAISYVFGIDCSCLDVSFNIPGGMPVDGPSAGVAFCAAFLSAFSGKPIRKPIAFTGEVTQKGEVRVVGGISDKVKAAGISDAKEVVLPIDNIPESDEYGVKLTGIRNIHELMNICFETAPESMRSVQTVI